MIARPRSQDPGAVRSSHPFIGWLMFNNLVSFVLTLSFQANDDSQA
jgi:hypothetical protein